MTTTTGPAWRTETTPTGSGRVVKVAGSLNWHRAPELRAAVSQPGATRVLVDLAEAQSAVGIGQTAGLFSDPAAAYAWLSAGSDGEPQRG